MKPQRKERTTSVEDKFRLWREKPVAFVEDMFGVTPDAWQREALERFPSEPQMAMISCKGPGKSAFLAWIGWNFLVTRPHPMIGATSISGANLKSGLWTELARWYSQPNLAADNPHRGMLLSLFEMTKSEIFLRQHPKTWKLEARTWAADADPAQIGNALAGVHALYVMWLADETGDYPAAIMPTLQAIFAGSPTEAHIVIAGNPTRTEGPLYLSATKDRKNWYVINITADPDDPKRTPRVSVEHARKQIETYGRENPWVLVNIFGQFPPTSINALIGPEAIEQSMKRYYREDEFKHAAKILGVDVARFGDDCFDSSTEILTDHGWKLFADLQGHERVYSMDGDKASWEPIDKIHEYDFDGEMNLFESKAANFCVTDKHRLWVKTNPKSARYKFTSIRDLPLDFVMRDGGGWSGRSRGCKRFTSRKPMPHGGTHVRSWKFDFLQWAAFLGWFVSEGNVYRERRPGGRLRICIAQNPGPKQEKIRELLSSMGLRPRLNASGRQLEFANIPIGRWLIEQCGVGAAQKRVPPEIRNGSEATIRAFLDAFLLGDGTARADGNGRTYFTSSKLLADDLQEMLAKLGRAGRLRLKDRKGSTFQIGNRTVVRDHDTYVLYERSFNWGKSINKRKIKRVRYTGKIWCVSTRFQSIYVRRNGVPMWSGNSSVIFPRQGIQAFPVIQMRNVNSIQGAARVAAKWGEWGADACFIDNSGGFGAGWIDALHSLGRSPIPVDYSGEPLDPRYFNKRAEMYFLGCEWIKGGGALPEIPELLSALVATTYTYKGERLLLEPKEQIKLKLGFSPDHADAFVQTFHSPVQPQRQGYLPAGVRPRFQVDYDPFRGM